MLFLKKASNNSDNSSKKTKEEKNLKTSNTPKIKVKKKKKIGFGHKEKVKTIDDAIQKNKMDKELKNDEVEPDIIESDEIISSELVEEDSVEDKTDAFQDELASEQETKTTEKEIGKQWSNTKKKLLPRNMKGKPVYLEDTGEKLGTVFDMMYDTNKKHIGYKIKDKKTDSVLSFPIGQFDTAKDGLIFIQGWYTKAVKTIEQLEFKERVSPELTTLISDDTISNEELYNIFVKHDDQMANYIEEAVALKELLKQHLNVLERQRLALKDDLMDLTEKRLIKDIDRREFSEDVIKHRNKVNVLDVNINKCKELLGRLDKTSFGRLSIQIVKNIDIKDTSQYVANLEKDRSSLVFNEEIEKPYKQKYDDMKQRFDQLEEEYTELKSAVEKLFSKGEI